LQCLSAARYGAFRVSCWICLRAAMFYGFVAQRDSVG
jgi:hypothetical protein